MSQKVNCEELDIRKKEIRVAVVFYGGVSLAIYENGVAQSFFDLVHKQHVFKLVLEMLQADAVVDVLSGASAGGINSLLLCSALEHGNNIKATNKLWRELADFGELIFKPTESRPDSLLDRDNAFLNRLILGFKDLAQKKINESEGFEPVNNEIDLFVTGTDLHGRIYQYIDQTGSIINDKDHRAVFQLKYRPGNEPDNPRRRVGVTTEFLNKPGLSKDELIETQATTLASIARITASFPGAFPPYSVNKIENKAVVKDVQEALRYFADIKKSEISDGRRFYVDGGTLNNKPFEPVLKSIFYRMPDGLVERKLFYVEPNPEQPREESLYGTEKSVTPLNVIMSTASSIPLHQSIRDNLEILKAHNSKVDWLSSFRDSAKDSLKTNVFLADDVAKIYLNTRIESTAKSILLQTIDPPKAEDRVMELGKKYEEGKKELKIEDYLLDLIQIVIKGKLIKEVDSDAAIFLEQKEIVVDEIAGLKKMAENDLNLVINNIYKSDFKSILLLMIEKFNAYDVNYLQRKCFYILYEIYDEIYPESQNSGDLNGDHKYSDEEKKQLLQILFLTGRIIKLVNLLRVAIIRLRDKILEETFVDFYHDGKIKLPNVDSLVEVLLDLLVVPDETNIKDEDLWNCETLTSLQDIMNDVDKGNYSWDKIYGILSKGLSTENLNELNRSINRTITNTDFVKKAEEIKSKTSSKNTETTILYIIEIILNFMVISRHSPLKNKHFYQNFINIDSLVFPQQYLSGIFEKDKIDFIRISPRDADLGLSDLPISSKIAGDEISSFGGFLRRDWRSNDILWGRLDSICQIIKTLLTEQKINKILEDTNLVEAIKNNLKDPTKLDQYFPNLPNDDVQIQNVIQSWNDLSAKKGSIENFLDNLILATHNNIVSKDLYEIYEDMYYQEIKWDLINSETSQNLIQPGATEKVIESEARRMAEDSIKGIPESDRGEHFKKMKIGEEKAIGDNSSIPKNILAEYLTNTWLVLIGMLKVSIDNDGKKKTIFDSNTFKFVARHPVLYLNMLLKMAREEKQLSIILTTVITTISVLTIVYSLFSGILTLNKPTSWLWLIIPVVVLIILYKFNFIRLFRDKRK